MIYLSMTLSEENYLKAIYHLTAPGSDASTNAIAEQVEAKASSVTDMLKKLADKDLITYKKYQGVSLTDSGLHSAKMIVRKHRLWEVFLVEKLGFQWDEVHEIAEQLEHIKSEQLVARLDEFLDFPSQDPHGDPIPNARGEISATEKMPISEMPLQRDAIVVGVRDSSSSFLKYLDRQEISLGTAITATSREDFDGSMTIIAGENPMSISARVANNLFVKLI